MPIARHFYDAARPCERHLAQRPEHRTRIERASLLRGQSEFMNRVISRRREEGRGCHPVAEFLLESTGKRFVFPGSELGEIRSWHINAFAVRSEPSQRAFLDIEAGDDGRRPRRVLLL